MTMILVFDEVFIKYIFIKNTQYILNILLHIF